MQTIGITTRDDAKVQDMAPKIQLMARNRERAIDELINTEHKYVNRLERLKSLYIEPLQNEKNSILCLEHHETLFPKVLSSMIPLNKALLSSLKSQRSTIGKEMNQFIPYFKMYQQYLNQYDAINTLMQHYRKNKNNYFSTYLRTHDKNDKYTLESYLIEPIQRIVRYELLIKEIVKYTETQHHDFNDLQTCLAKMSNVNKQINTRIAEYEQRHKVFLIEMSIINLDINQRYSSSTNIFASWFTSFNANHKSQINKFRLVSPSRRFIKQGYLTKVSRKGHIRYRFVLFNDILIYCSDTMNRMMILHQRINLNDAYFELKKVEKNKELCDYNAFEIHSIEKSFIAYAATYKETGEWYDAIQKEVDHIRDTRNLGVLDADAVLNEVNDVASGERIIETAPMWSPKQQNTQCMMANCRKLLTGWLTSSYHCNYCGKVVCAECFQHKLLHYDPAKRKENCKVGVCNECYREHRTTARRASLAENDMKLNDIDDLESDEEESEEDIAKGFLCFQQLLSMGFDQHLAWKASKQYKDVKHAVQYIQQSGLDTDKKVNMKDIDELIGSKYRSVDFDIFVAIDFGTHGTGLGYAVKQKKMQQWGGNTEDEYEYVTFLETDWSGTPSGGEIKNKTDILLTYDGKFIAFGYEALNKYKSVEDEDMSDYSDCDEEDEKVNMEQRDMLFESFKMSLYKTKGESKGDIKEKIPCKDGRLFSTEIVFVEALKFIKDTIFRTFKKNGLNITDSESDLQRIQWILTVPAIWSDRAKYKMELWAAKAGLIRPDIQNHLRIVYEPDCASISCQYERNQKSQLITESKPFEKGEKYILIDAGGGTVDIACHEVVEEDQMQELYHPTGGPWGSDYVDGYFVTLLGVLFGGDVVHQYIQRYPHDFTKIIDNFRHAKMTFYQNESRKDHATQLTSSFILEQDVDVDMEQFIANKTPFGLKDSVRLKNETLFLSFEIWTKHLFDEVMDPMVQHIEDLLGNKVGTMQYICICGGLSSSKYFQTRIQEAFGKPSKYKLQIRIPIKPILSVIDGAVRLATRPNYIVGRKLRMTYGIATDRTLDQLDTSRLPNNYLNTHMTRARSASATTTVSGLFSKFICKNDLVKIGEPIEKEYKRFDINERKKVIKIYCDSARDPYVVCGEPLAEFPVYFKRNYNALQFKVKFYFGNTKIRVFAMNEELHLKYKFYNPSKFIELKPPPKPIIEGIEMNEKELKMAIRVECDGYDDIEYRAWFEVEFVDCDMDCDFELKDKKYETSPIILTDLRIGVEYKIAIKCVNDNYTTCSEVYKETFILKHKPPTPIIKNTCAADSMVRLEYECDAIQYRFNENDDACHPQYEIKHDRDRHSMMTRETSTEIDSLQNGIDYKFKIRAVNKYGESHWTEWMVLTPLKQPYKPTDLHLVVGSSSIAVYWLSFDNMEEEYLCGQFEIISEPHTKRKTVCTKHKVEFKASCDGLQSDICYKFKVIATNKNFCVESDWTPRVQLDKTKEKSAFKQEKKTMMMTIYKLHQKLYTKNKQSDTAINDKTMANKRNENIKRISHNLSKQNAQNNDDDRKSNNI